MGGLSLDLMDDFQNRFLINGVQLGIKLWPNKKRILSIIRRGKCGL